MKEDKLIKLYTTTVFLQQQIKVLPNTFAIVTAYNPRGKIISNESNLHNNSLLTKQIASLKHWGIIGCSPDLSYQEPSFAIEIAKHDALKLAAGYKQNAIFWVEGNKLYLEAVLMNFEKSILVGEFTDRLVN